VEKTASNPFIYPNKFGLFPWLLGDYVAPSKVINPAEAAPRGHNRQPQIQLATCQNIKKGCALSG